ncbi:MAG: terpene cyclase/mutase family protein [Planctomycetes bacterium]|nr:terpene cyclase/mutase family protein [Planctomycetota bacterium]
MIKNKTAFAFFIIALFGLAGFIFAQGKPPGKKDEQARPKIDQQKVDGAIRKGVAFLVKNTNITFDLTDYKKVTRKFRPEELILYTIVHAGAEEADIDKLLEKVLSNELDFTYHVALRAMTLEAIDMVKYQDEIKNCAQFLIDNQCANGQWSYGEKTVLEKPPEKDSKAQVTGTPDDSKKKPAPKKKGKDGDYADSVKKVAIKQKRKGPPAGDNSNSQYAALGLRACMQSGIIIPDDILKKALQWWRSSQTTDGGWHYAADGSAGQSAYGAMTAGGLGCLCIYDFYLKESKDKDKCIPKAVDWLAKNFTVTEHAKYLDTKKHHYYYLYALERAGILANTELFGNNEWYATGAEYLLKEQGENGSWMSNPIDTCFAVLFLRRATKPLKAVITK